jgi:hypothetical protein
MPDDNLILRRREAPSRRMATYALATILRDAAFGGLLTMRPGWRD